MLLNMNIGLGNSKILAEEHLFFGPTLIIQLSRDWNWWDWIVDVRKAGQKVQVERESVTCTGGGAAV